MFREMRRIKQVLSQEESTAVLERGTSGVLAVSGDEDYPYAVPLSYVYSDSKLYFHCAKMGHKLDAIGRNSKVSFCVIDQDQLVPGEYTTYFRSVIVFGRAQVLENPVKKREALAMMAAKYSPEQEQGRIQEVEAQLKNVCIVQLNVEHISGKEAIELTKMRSE